MTNGKLESIFLKDHAKMRKHLSEPWFSLVCTGRKKFEGRLASNKDFAAAREGTFVTWVNNDLPFERSCRVQITGKSVYKSFREMLEDQGVERVLPTVASPKHGAAVYRAFYSAERERRAGVLCIHMKLG